MPVSEEEEQHKDDGGDEVDTSPVSRSDEASVNGDRDSGGGSSSGDGSGGQPGPSGGQADSPVGAAVEVPSIPLLQGRDGRESVVAQSPAWHEDLNGDVQAGTIFLTDFRLAFACAEGVLTLPLGAVHTLEKKRRHVYEGGYRRDIGMLKVAAKDSRVARFFLERPLAAAKRKRKPAAASAAAPDGLDMQRLYTQVEAAVQKVRAEPENAFRLSSSSAPAAAFDLIREYARMGVLESRSGWRSSDANSDYGLCPTYSQRLFVPAAVTDDQLAAVASFRSKQRLPILSWLHPIAHNAPGGGKARAAIVRSSQPLVGMWCRRSAADQGYINAIAEANPGSLVLIVDARPELNAMMNRFRNGGFEQNYSACELEFQNIQNIHAVRSSLDRMHWYYTSSQTRDHVGLDQVNSTCWLVHVGMVLTAAAKIVKTVDEHHRTVLVHCSDGWDRTSQLTSLAALCLDPYYRTVEGFEILIEKEWHCAGHKFRDRVGQGHERSPIFFQFLDSVYQLTVQYPRAFEFNEWLLVSLTDQLYGTAQANSIKEDADAYLRRDFWMSARSQGQYLNPSYTAGRLVVLQPTVTCPLRVWSSYFQRWRMRPIDGYVAGAAQRPSSQPHATKSKSVGISEAWPIPDTRVAARAVVFCPIALLIIVAALVFAAIAMGVIKNGRPSVTAVVTRFEPRGTNASNRENSLDLLLRNFVQPTAWLRCSDCNNYIDVIANSQQAGSLIGNTLSSSSLKYLCQLEDWITSTPSFREDCANDGGGGCCPPQSLGRVVATLNGFGCSSMDDVALKNSLDLLGSCSQRTVSKCGSVPSFVDCGNDFCAPQTTCAHQICDHSQLIRNHLVDLAFDGYHSRYVRVQICLDDIGTQADSETVDDTTADVLSSYEEWISQLGNLAVTVSDSSNRMFEAFSTEQLRLDMLYVAIALCIIALITWLVSRSVFIAMLGLFHAVAAWALVMLPPFLPA
jgi:hypothetical protein